MRFTTNAEAAKGIVFLKIFTPSNFVFENSLRNSWILCDYLISLGINGDGYGGESTAILIDKALEHQNALGVSYFF